MNALIKEISENSLVLSVMSSYKQNTVVYEPGGGFSPAGALILDLPASRTVRDKCCLSLLV